ncbi:MAG: MFS transporter [Steroidobacteraceae bacterium]|jgi:MFS family permease|nr:MFS transporter [Steroidobacteraceae bacterium]
MSAVPAPVAAATAAATIPEADWPRPRVAWYMVIVLMLAYILSFIDRVILGLLVGPIRADLGISETQMSLLYGFVFAVFYTGLGVPIAWAIDRYNRRNIIVVGVALWSGMTALCGVARGFVELALARIGVAVGEAVLSPATYSMAGDSFPEKKLGRALSVFVIGLPLGVGLALVIGGYVIKAVSASPAYTLPLIGTIRAWQLTFLLVGVPGLLLALWIMTLAEPARRQHTDAVQKASVGDTLRFMRARWQAYASLVLGFSVLGMVMNVFQIYGVQYFVRVLQVPLSEAGLRVGGAIAVCGTAGILVGGWLTDRWRAAGRLDAAMRVGLTASVALIPFAAACTLLDDLALSTAFLLPIGFFTAFAFGAGATGVVVLTPPPMRAQASAIYLLFVNLIGIGLAPFLTAAITQYGFADDLAVGKSCAIVAGGATLIASVLFVWGLPRFRAALAAATVAG